jgi:hypothetical protein
MTLALSAYQQILLAVINQFGIHKPELDIREPIECEAGLPFRRDANEVQVLKQRSSV